MDADQKNKLKVYKANTEELSRFFRYYFIWLLGVGLVGFFLLNIGGDVFDWGLRNFSFGLFPKLTVILPLAFILLFPPIIAYYGANYFMRKSWLGELIRLILVYVALVVYFVASVMLFSAKVGFSLELGWYGKTIVTLIVLFILLKSIRLYSQATRQWMPPGGGGEIQESAGLVEKIVSRMEIALVALMWAFIFIPLAYRFLVAGQI